MQPNSSTGLLHNCRSINTGLLELKRLIYNLSPIFAALTETWLNNNRYILCGISQITRDQMECVGTTS